MLSEASLRRMIRKLWDCWFQMCNMSAGSTENLLKPSESRRSEVSSRTNNPQSRTLLLLSSATGFNLKPDAVRTTASPPNHNSCFSTRSMRFSLTVCMFTELHQISLESLNFLITPVGPAVFMEPTKLIYRLLPRMLLLVSHIPEPHNSKSCIVSFLLQLSSFFCHS